MIVLDSSFLIAWHNTRDVHHVEASRSVPQLLAGKWGPCLLPEYVFLEVVTLISRKLDHAAAVSIGELLLSAGEVEFVPCTPLFVNTFESFRSGAAGLSFVDSAIVAVARARNAPYVATFDAAFRTIEAISVVPD